MKTKQYGFITAVLSDRISKGRDWEREIKEVVMSPHIWIIPTFFIALYTVWNLPEVLTASSYIVNGFSN